MSAKNKEPEVTNEAGVVLEPVQEATVEAPIEAEGSNLTKQQVSEAEQQAITENAVNRVNQEFVDSHTPSVREEQPASEEQVAYDAQDKPKAVKKTFEHEGVKVSFPSDMSRSQAFIHLTKLTQEILSGAD